MNKENIVEKIRKLLALSQSDNEAEASLAMQRVHELLVKYNLEMEEVKVNNTPVTKEVMADGQRLKEWRLELAVGIAKAYFCKTLITNFDYGYYEFNLVGKPHNIEIAKSMYEYLESAIMRISKKNIRKNAKAKYRESYKYGMAMRLADRLQEKMHSYGEKTDRKSKALVVNLYENEKMLIEEFLSGKKIGTFDKKFKNNNGSAISRGYAAGANVSLNNQLYGNQLPLLR